MATSVTSVLSQITPGQRRTLVAAALGWMLDSFDAMLYALVLTYIMRDLGMSKATSGLLYTLTLLASGIGGVLFGFVADRIGRKRALVTLWIQSSVPESRMWEEQHRLSEKRSSHPGMVPGSLNVEHTSRRGQEDASFAQIFRPPYLKKTLALLFVNFFGMFAWWGLFTWIPPYLSLPVSQGGRGFGVMGTTTLLIVLNLAGMFPGYASFGWVADRLGRRKSFIVYTFMASLLVPLYAIARQPAALLVLGTVVAFFGTGFFSGSGIIGSEIFPTAVRARALGFTYNGARTMSCIAPYVIGRVGQAKGLGWAAYLCAISFLFASLVATFFFSSRRRHTRFDCDWSSDVCSSDLASRVERSCRTIDGACGGCGTIAASPGFSGAICGARGTHACRGVVCGDGFPRAREIGRASCRERV